jgi:hypothetical protein
MLKGLQKFGGCSRTRTCDPLIKSQLLWTELLSAGRLRHAEHQRKVEIPQ